MSADARRQQFLIRTTNVGVVVVMVLVCCGGLSSEKVHSKYMQSCGGGGVQKCSFFGKRFWVHLFLMTTGAISMTIEAKNYFSVHNIYRDLVTKNKLDSR